MNILSILIRLVFRSSPQLNDSLLDVQHSISMLLFVELKIPNGPHKKKEAFSHLTFSFFISSSLKKRTGDFLHFFSSLWVSFRLEKKKFSMEFHSEHIFFAFKACVSKGNDDLVADIHCLASMAYSLAVHTRWRALFFIKEKNFHNFDDVIVSRNPQHATWLMHK